MTIDVMTQTSDGLIEWGNLVLEKALALWADYTGDEVRKIGFRYSQVDGIVGSNQMPQSSSFRSPHYYLEVKSKRVEKDRYRILFIDAHRYHNLAEIQRLTGAPTCYLIVFVDGAGFIHLPSAKVSFTQKAMYDGKPKAAFAASELKWIPDEWFMKYYAEEYKRLTEALRAERESGSR